MGQPIEVAAATVLGDVAMFDTDRTLSGQDGEAYQPGGPVGATFPSRLAQRVFESDRAVDHVYVFSNSVSVRRRGGWDDESLGATRRLLTDFFVFYDENKGT